MFAKVAAHDLKEPLRKIYTFVEMIMMQEAAKLSNSGRSNFRRIQQSVQRMGLLTDDIVNFSEMSRAGKMTPINLTQVVQEAVSANAAPIAQSGARIAHVNLPVITGYRSALFQLFYQLVNNAIKFRREAGEPAIRIDCKVVEGYTIKDKRADPEQCYFDLAVADNGIGFEPQYRTRIFELFQRLHHESSYRGSGMGLAIALKAARMHDGFITADGTPDNGSIFHVYLPEQ